MGTPLTRQDMMAISDSAKNAIVQKMLSRQDVQTVTDTARDRVLNTVNTFHVENQNLLRQGANQSEQMTRRVVTIEQQIGSLRQEVRALTQAIDRLYEVQAQQYNQIRTVAANVNTNDQRY